MKMVFFSPLKSTDNFFYPMPFIDAFTCISSQNYINNKVLKTYGMGKVEYVTTLSGEKNYI